MSLLPNNSSVKTVEVSATLTRTIESIDADGEKQTSAREVSANVKTTVPYSANPESEAGVTSSDNERDEGDREAADSYEADPTLEQILADMISAGMQPRGAGNRPVATAATVTRPKDPMRPRPK
ncbi:hypothetical protein BC629DRAFT_1590600 [Irpex lacteus]|nr:hypothetical protein BC629DRAFT_1590600 [Irpex lacteus]